MIPLAKPYLGEEEIEAVSQVLRSGQIASGPMVRRFEQEFAAYIGVRHAIAVANGTVALHAALLGVGVQPGDRVVTTPFTFIATANSILHAGAVPVFCDIEPDTYNMCPESLRQTLQRLADAGTPAKVVMPVHLFGLTCDMARIRAVASEFGAVIVEDAAQAHGAAYRGRRAGSFGLAAAFSFYATKNLATGEGGMVVTDSDEVAERVRRLINHGRVGRYVHDRLGYNYRMTDIAAAIGLVQLRKLEQMNLRRRRNARRLTEALADIGEYKLPVEPEGYYHVYHQYTVRHKNRDALSEELRRRGVDSAAIYPLALHQQPFYQKLGYGNERLPVAEEAARHVLSVPVHASLTDEQVETVVQAMIEAARVLAE
ncbi:MAG: DegT/DnrJ/EryC1/StrS family aminotransferase [Limnochordales bacterium]|nr:aminotransferase DegT [Bacillota bacterium]